MTTDSLTPIVHDFNGRKVEIYLDEVTGKKYIRPEHVTILPRMRKEVKDIDKMMMSLQTNGQFNPIMLDEDGALIQGFRRLTSAIGLGLELIWFSTREDLDETGKKILELEENIQRQQMTPFEEAEALAEIHQLMEGRAKAEGKVWQKEDTAAYVGKSRQSVYNAISVTEAAKDTPEIREAATVTGALAIVERRRKLEKKRVEVEMKSRGQLPSKKAEILVGDALELIKLEPNEKFDCVATNFPFGVDLHYQGKPKSELYHDEEYYITDLVRSMVPQIHRVLKDDSWFVGFFDVRKITYSTHTKRLSHLVHQFIQGLDVQALSPDQLRLMGEMLNESIRAMGLAGWLEDAGFDYVQVVPCVWVKPNKTQGNIGNPERGMVVAYEAFIFAAKGSPPLLKRGRQNIFIYDTVAAADRIHDVQMAVDICRETLSMVTLAGTHVLDCFAGSGSYGVAALDLQCDFTGYELDPKKADAGNVRLKGHIYADTPTQTEEGEDVQEA